jgi:hypothetical protein
MIFEEIGFQKIGNDKIQNAHDSGETRESRPGGKNPPLPFLIKGGWGEFKSYFPSKLTPDSGDSR